MNALTTNSGQICFAATRVYVQAGIYDEFIEQYQAALQVKKGLIGDPSEQGNEIGPVVDEGQYTRIMDIISTAQQEGAGTLLAGGQRIGKTVSTPFFVRKCKFSGVSHDQLLTKDIFSPPRASTSNPPYSQTPKTVPSCPRARSSALSW